MSFFIGKLHGEHGGKINIFITCVFLQIICISQKVVAAFYHHYNPFYLLLTGNVIFWCWGDLMLLQTYPCCILASIFCTHAPFLVTSFPDICKNHASNMSVSSHVPLENKNINLLRSWIIPCQDKRHNVESIQNPRKTL